MTSDKIVSDKRAAILEATLHLISARGFHDTPMSLIAKTSGVSTGIIYHYFDGKASLINELYLEIKLEMIRGLLAGFSVDIPFHEGFLRIWFNLVHYSLENPTKGLFLEQFEHSPFLRPELQEEYGKHMAPLLDYIQKAIKAGVLKNLPFEVLFDLGFGAAIALAKRHVAGKSMPDEDLIEATANACWDAIKQ